MRMAKRIMAVLLAIVLAFGSLTATAFAADEPEVTAEPAVEFDTDLKSYYDPVTQSFQDSRVVTLVRDGVTEWTTGWYATRGNTLELGQVTVAGDVNLILPYGTSLTVNGGSLTIWGDQKDSHQDGVLTAIASHGAAIGSNRNGSDVRVTINGGVINADGLYGGAGIGGGDDATGDVVIINDGVISATGSVTSAGIGCSGGTATVTINGGSVNATGNSGSFRNRPTDAVGHPVYLLQVDNPRGEAVKVNGFFWNGINNVAVDGDTNLYMYLPETEPTVDVVVGDGPTERFRLNRAAGRFESAGSVTVDPATRSAQYYDPNEGSMQQARNVHVVKDGVTTWENGWYVADGAVTLDRVTVYSHVDLILPKGTSITVNRGVTVKDGCSLTIWGQDKDPTKSGTLSVQGGICIASGAHSGDIIINGGVINTTGGGAAIGGVTDSAGTVTINGGVVTAYGDEVNAALGRGPNGGDATLTITGGSGKAIGYVSPQPVGANGKTAFLLQIPNPNGEGVIINGAAWNVNNHAASGEDDTDLYAYIALSEVVAKVGGGTPVRYILNKDTGLYETAAAVNYYDPASRQVQTRDSAEPLVNDMTNWTADGETGGWYIALGTVTTRQVTVSGDVNLVLANGAALTVSNGIQVQEGSHLTIWG